MIAERLEALNAEYSKRKREFDKQQRDAAKTKPRDSKKRAKNKLFKEFDKTSPQQNELFKILDSAVGSEITDAGKYSQTLELYDFVPKFVWGKPERIEGRFLDPIRRQFECRGVKYNLVVAPAFIEDGNGFLACFPGKREDLVEDALKKLMTEGDSIYLDDNASIAFTLYQLRKELADYKHTYSYDQLKEALEILTKTSVEIESEDKTVKLIFSPIEMLGLDGVNEETQTYVKFSSLFTRSINEGAYRLFNYDKVMSYSSVIARQMHKRLAHNYTQANLSEYYSIMLSTIIRDFGLKPQSRPQQNLQKVEEAIVELKDKNVILNCKIEKIFETKGKQKLLDVKFNIQAHPEFISEVKKANHRAREVKALLHKNDLEPLDT